MTHNNNSRRTYGTTHGGHPHGEPDRRWQRGQARAQLEDIQDRRVRTEVRLAPDLTRKQVEAVTRQAETHAKPEETNATTSQSRVMKFLRSNDVLLVPAALATLALTAGFIFDTFVLKVVGGIMSVATVPSLGGWIGIKLIERRRVRESNGNQQ